MKEETFEGKINTSLDNEYYVIRTDFYNDKSLFFINLLTRSCCFLPTNHPQTEIDHGSYKTYGHSQHNISVFDFGK